MENQENDIYIWSNGHKYDILEQYGRELGNAELDLNGLHVFLNTCVPLKANHEPFCLTRNISIHGSANQRCSPTGFFGYEEFRQFHDILLSSYVIYDFTNLWKLPRDLEKTMEFNQYLRTGFVDYRWDEKCYMENYPTDKVDKCTTGVQDNFHDEAEISIRQHNIGEFRCQGR